MTKDVLVSVRGIQFDVDEQDEIELITTGNYYFKNGKHYVIYKEQASEDNEQTTNTVKITDDKIDILRKGASNTHLVFDAGKKNMTYYNTPVGAILVGIHTNKVNVTEEDNMIDIKVSYTLEINYNFVSECNLSIVIQGGDNKKINLQQS